jgi:hypothetical protein
VDEYGSLLHPWESALSFKASHPMELSSVMLVSLVSSSDYTLKRSVGTAHDEDTYY